jgi:predicted transcriptional regulator
MLTPAERRVMEVLWRRGGPCTVREVFEALQAGPAPAYTTVLTVMRVLTAKGYLVAREDGRAHVFSAKLTQAQARRRALKNLVGEFFGGSPAALAQHLVSEELDEKERAELEKLLARDLSDD